MNDFGYLRCMTGAQETGNSCGVPTGFVRAVLDDARYTDSLLDLLEARLVALEEVAAARGVRRQALATRLGRVLRDSVRPFAGRSFAERRREAVTTEWLSAQSGHAGHGAFPITWQHTQKEPGATVERRPRRRDGRDECR